MPPLRRTDSQSSETKKLDEMLRTSGCDSVEELRKRAEHFLSQIQAAHVRSLTSKPTILHWSQRIKALIEWFWYEDLFNYYIGD